MPRRLLSPILLLTAMTVGCTDQPANDAAEPSDQVLAQEKTGDAGESPNTEVVPAKEDDEGESPDLDVVPTEDGVTVSGKKPVFMGGLRRHEVPLDSETVALNFARIGPVSLELSDLPPTADPVEPGTYLLSIVIQLTSGSFNKNQWPCRVEVEGPDVRILLENRGTDPIIARLEDGYFLSEPREGRGTYGLEGQVVGPGKLRGVVIPGPDDHPSVGIVAGRWGLDALPLPETTEETEE